jgi:outer membrane receptor protein involved in Fe transport
MSFSLIGRLRLCGLSLVLCCSILAQSPPAQTSDLSGVVKDLKGAAIAEATITLLNARQAVVASTHTDENGRFILRGIAPGTYELLAGGARGFAPRSKALRVPGEENAGIEIVLGFEALTAETTVSAEIGLVQSLDQTTQQVNVIDERKLEQRATSVLAQIAREEPGLQLQRTSSSIGAIFVRGTTGAKVVNYLDGIRFSTASARGGINTFFNLNDAGNLRAVEVIRGPSSAQFGSDSIGGSVQLVSRAPLFTDGKVETHGRLATHYNSADHSFGSSALVSIGGKDLAVLLNLAGHRSNTVRPGGGFESHSVLNRFLGLRSSDLLGSRSTDTAFTRYGGLFKLSHRLSDHDQLSVHYQRGQIDGGKRFDQTLGGDGNLVADLRNFMLDFFYGRYERFDAGPFDAFTLSYSYNVQREERVNQGGNGNPLGGIVHQYERTLVHGAQAQASKQWTHNNLVIGGEIYRDRVRAPAFTFNPANNRFAPSRPRVPDRATYRSIGVYLQDAWVAIPERLRLVGALRYGRASYHSRAANSPLLDERPLWPDDQLAANALTPRAGLVFTIAKEFNLSAQVSRGVRTPHITDLGTLGITGNGFEADAPGVAGLGATIGSTADRNAVSTGRPVAQLKPESSWSYEAGLHLHRSRIDIDVNGFINDIHDNIAVQALILPAGAANAGGLSLGGERITSQTAAGAVFVAASTNPVLIRANFDDARIWGIEQKFDLQITGNLRLGQNYTYLRATDKHTGLPPNIEGGTPAPQGNLHVRYDAPNRRLWIEPYVHGARRQTRLSTLDLEDRRTGATRSRASIANFFRRGATARGFIAPGPDGRLGTTDDVLKATGETLLAVHTRLLGAAESAPLYRYIPGYLTVGVRGGIRLRNRQDILIEMDNLNDKNYRGISWGMDAPGRSVGFRYSYRF